MATYTVRTLTEDCEVEAETEYDSLEEAWDGFHIVGMFTFDTESEFFLGDPYWTVQLIQNEGGTVLAETNSVLEAKHG